VKLRSRTGGREGEKKAESERQMWQRERDGKIWANANGWMLIIIIKAK